MSEYLRYVIERAGAPTPARVAVFPAGEEWADRQIVDEVNSIFPHADVVSGDRAAATGADMAIFPFATRCFEDHANLREWLGVLRRIRTPWVVLYGLANRELVVVRGTEIPRLYRRWRNVERLNRVLRALRADGLCARLIGLVS